MNRPPAHGAAVVMAILIVALATTIASFMAYQQFGWLLLAGSLDRYSQAAAVSQAAFDWGRVMLYDDAQQGQVDYVGEEWSKPMLSIPVDGGDVSGQMTDQQSFFNLNDLISQGGNASPADMAIFRRILASVGLPEAMADAVTDWIDQDSNKLPAGAEDGYYLGLPVPYRTANQPMVDLSELYLVKGFDQEAVDKLRPYVTALPARTPINVNTAGLGVLAAVLPTVPKDKLQAAINRRQQQPYQSVDEFQQALQLTTPLDTSELSVNSSFFSEEVSVRLGKQQMVSLASYSSATSGKCPRSSGNGRKTVESCGYPYSLTKNGPGRKRKQRFPGSCMTLTGSR